MPPPAFDGYEILEEVGAGNFGAVYKAFSSKLQKSVAVKVLPSHLAKDERFVARFRREAEALEKLDHPNIVRVIEFGSGGSPNGTAHYLAMEWLDGGSLERDIEHLDHLPAEEEFLRVFGACAEGLAFAHRQGVVHRDLTPANIFLTLDREVKLVDFGFAKLLNEATISATGEILGSAPYMSPEQFQNSSAVDHLSDIFGLGAVGYRFATKKFPYGSDNPGTILKRMADPAFHVTAPIVFNRNISVKTDSILRKCLEREPRRRYQSVEGILTDLKYGDPDEPAAGYVSASAAARPTVPAIQPHCKKIPWVWILGACLLLSAAVAVVGIKKGWFKDSLRAPPHRAGRR